MFSEQIHHPSLVLPTHEHDLSPLPVARNALIRRYANSALVEAYSTHGSAAMGSPCTDILSDHYPIKATFCRRSRRASRIAAGEGGGGAAAEIAAVAVAAAVAREGVTDGGGIGGGGGGGGVGSSQRLGEKLDVQLTEDELEQCFQTREHASMLPAHFAGHSNGGGGGGGGSGGGVSGGGSRGDGGMVGRAAQSEADSACTPEMVCRWKREWHQEQLIRQRQRLELERSYGALWRQEEGPGVWRTVPGRRGQSCNQACATAPGLTFNESSQWLRVGYCNRDGVAAAHTCERLKKQFPCAGGACYVQETGGDQPCYVADDTHDNYGRCLVSTDPDASICAGSHFATERLCACSTADFTIVTGELGETCTEACARGKPGTRCEAALIPHINSCAWLQMYFPGCKAKGRCSRNAKLHQPVYVGNGTAKGYCFAADGLGHRCSAYHKSLQRLCPCAKGATRPRSAHPRTRAPRVPVPNAGACDHDAISQAEGGDAPSCRICAKYYDGRYAPGYRSLSGMSSTCVYVPAEGKCYPRYWAHDLKWKYEHRSACPYEG